MKNYKKVAQVAVSIIAIGLLLFIAITISGIKTELGTDEEYVADPAYTLETDYLDVTVEGFKDDIEVASRMEYAVGEVERLLPKNILELVDIPIYIRATNKDCNPYRACTNAKHEWIETNTPYAPSISTLVHEIGHAVGHYGRTEDGVSYYDALEQVAKEAKDEPVSPYAGTNKREYFAVSMERYVSNPVRLKASAPATYAFMRDLMGRRYLATDAYGESIRFLEDADTAGDVPSNDEEPQQEETNEG